MVAARYLQLAVLKDVTVSLLNSSCHEAIDAMGVPASKRIRRPSEFLKVRNQGIRILCGPFIFQSLIASENTVQLTRFGVIASRRVGNAVKRQRGKRIFREIFRINETALPTGADVVVVLRANFDQYAFSDLQARYLKACARITFKNESANNE